MIIEIKFTAEIDFVIELNGAAYQIKKQSTSVRLEYIPEFNKTYTLSIISTDFKILEYPITIIELIFDDFWSLTGNRVSRGSNIYDDSYIKYASDNNINISHEVHDNCILFFTGRLDFTFTHPIYETLY
jgi:hypothetical protein